MNTSPHIKMVNCSQHLQGWDSPDISPPLTPDRDIPRYYTNAYKARMRALNLPEEECFQGPSFTINDEDPLPPHLSEEPVRWGQTPRPKSPQDLYLIDYLEDMCSKITPLSTIIDGHTL